MKFPLLCLLLLADKSPPTRGRELKYGEVYEYYTAGVVAPHAGAGIEIEKDARDFLQECRPPRGGGN